MQGVYECPECSELFTVSYFGNEVPGFKDREDIDCPRCRHTCDREMTSLSIRTHALSDEQKAKHRAGK